MEPELFDRFPYFPPGAVVVANEMPLWAFFKVSVDLLRTANKLSFKSSTLSANESVKHPAVAKGIVEHNPLCIACTRIHSSVKSFSGKVSIVVVVSGIVRRFFFRGG